MKDKRRDRCLTFSQVYDTHVEDDECFFMDADCNASFTSGAMPFIDTAIYIARYEGVPPEQNNLIAFRLVNLKLKAPACDLRGCLNPFAVSPHTPSGLTKKTSNAGCLIWKNCEQ